MSDHDTERPAPDTGGAPNRTSSRKRTLTEKARGVGAATEDEVAAASSARADDTIIHCGKRVTKAAYEAYRATLTKRGPRPAAATPTPPPNLAANKILKQLAGSSRRVSVSTEGAPAASPSTGGGGGGAGAAPTVSDGRPTARTIKPSMQLIDNAESVGPKEFKDCVTKKCDGTRRDGGKLAPKGVFTPLMMLAMWLWSIATTHIKDCVSAAWLLKMPGRSPFGCIETLAKAKFFLDFYLRNVVPRFEHSHALPLEKDTNVNMTLDDVFEVLAVLFNYGRAARGLPLITGEQLQNLEDPLFYQKEDPGDRSWYADNIQMAAMRVNPIDIQTDATGVPTPEDVARNNGLCPKKLVTDDTTCVARACMGAARAFEGDVDPKKRDTWLFNNSDPGKPDTRLPTIPRLNAMAYAFAFCRIDCGLRTCKFMSRAKLAELGKSTQEYVLETFCPSLLKSTVKAKLNNPPEAELDRRVTPERVAAVVKFVDCRGWRVDTTAPAWREMGITAADVADRLKEVDTVAEVKGLKARV